MRKGLVIMGLAAVLGIGAALGVCAGTKKIIKIEDGKRVEINVEQSRQEAEAALTESTAVDPIAAEPVEIEPTAVEPTAAEPADLEYGGMEPALDEAFSVDTEGEPGTGVPDAGLEPGKVWGNVLEKLDGGFVIDNRAQEGYTGEMVIHIDPDNTRILDSITGFPAGEDTIAAGQTLYVYIRPMMTMSLPPQTTAELVLVNIVQDAGAPLYVTAASELEDDGVGGYVLKTVGGEEIKVSADCPITPYLTRQMVRLEDIAAGRKCLVWISADNRAERIVLFNE